MASILQRADYFRHYAQTDNHYHDCHEIIYVTKGSVQFKISNTELTATQGNLIIFSRFEQHAVTAQTEDYQRYVLLVDHHIPVDNRNNAKIFSILFNRPQRFQNVLDCAGCQSALQTIFAQIVREFVDSALLREEMLVLLMQELLVWVYRQFPDIFSVFEQNSFETIQQIQRQLETHYEQRFTLTELAEAYTLSASHLSHLFKQVTGSSVMVYLQSCRIAAAKKYLVETSLEIGQIIEACGFTDASNFSRTFRQQVGCSPTQFRSIYRE